jgi:hypothetical protein
MRAFKVETKTYGAFKRKIYGVDLKWLDELENIMCK